MPREKRYAVRGEGQGIVANIDHIVHDTPAPARSWSHVRTACLTRMWSLGSPHQPHRTRADRWPHGQWSIKRWRGQYRNFRWLIYI